MLFLLVFQISMISDYNTLVAQVLLVLLALTSGRSVGFIYTFCTGYHPISVVREHGEQIEIDNVTCKSLPLEHVKGK